MKKNTFKLNKADESRRRRLLPGGEPRWVRCYDAGDDVGDRYTVVYTGLKDGSHPFVGMSSAPYHPQGFCTHGTHGYAIDAPPGKWPPVIGRKNHLGRRIAFADLPADCRKLVYDDYFYYWDIKGPKPEVKG